MKLADENARGELMISFYIEIWAENERLATSQDCAYFKSEKLTNFVTPIQAMVQ